MKYSFPAFENGFVRAAAATPALHVADCAYNAQQIIDAMSVYAAQGVQLVCFPEFCLTGYTCSDLFLQAVRGVPGVRVLYITRENREGLFRLLKRDLAQAE